MDNNNTNTNIKFSQGTLVLLTLFDDSGVQIKFTNNNKSNLNDLLLYESDTSRVLRPETTIDSLNSNNFTICMRTWTRRQYYIVNGSFQSEKFMSSGIRKFTVSFLNQANDTVIKKESFQVNVIDRKKNKKSFYENEIDSLNLILNINKKSIFSNFFEPLFHIFTF
jgi:hypothetical protein